MRLFHNAWIAGSPPARGGILVDGGRIAAIVSPAQERELLAGSDTEAVDAGGHYVVPGFFDAHIHLRALAARRLRCDLSRADSAADAAARLAAFAADHPAADAVVGVDWDESAWNDPAPPTRGMLDGVDATRPVFARRVCGHVGVANNILLRALQGGESARFTDVAAGVLTEDAVWEANRLTAPPRDAVVDAFPAAVRDLHALGITGVCDIVMPGTVEDVRDGLAASAPLRAEALVVGSAADLERARAQCGRGSPLTPTGVKHFADGSIGARTAALREPYADAPTLGELLLDIDALAAAMRDAAGAGAVCAVHAIGDRAVHAVLSAFEGLAQRPRLRIEHAEVLDDGLIARIAAAEIPLVVQPNFIRNWGGVDGLYRRRLGERRWRMTNPLRSLAAAGVDVRFSSDGMPPGPLYGLDGAIHHPLSNQALPPAQALSRYLSAPLETGVNADLTLLSSDPLAADPGALAVAGTVVAGECVFRAGNT